jgi:ribonucleoside-diphosphate reductase alpha chain
VDTFWMVECAARRQKWIDQAQSLNIYMAGASGKRLDETYKLAWLRGLKTTYYLRTIGATHAEKSTLNTGQLNAVPVSGGVAGGASASGAVAAWSSTTDPIIASNAVPASDMKFCSIDNPDCEACQ